MPIDSVQLTVIFVLFSGVVQYSFLHKQFFSRDYLKITSYLRLSTVREDL